MLPSHIVFAAVVAITVSSGVGAVALVVIGGARTVSGRRAVAVRLAHIAVLGAAAIFTLLRPA